KVLGAVAVGAIARLANLLEEFAVAIEDEDVRIASAVAAEPDVAIGCDFDAVGGGEPGVAFAGTTPRFDQVTFGVELQYRWRGRTAFAATEYETDLAPVEENVVPIPMDDVDVVAAVHRNADHVAKYPVVGQWFGPEGVHVEAGRLCDRGFGQRLLLQPGGAKVQCQQRQCTGTAHQFQSHAHYYSSAFP